MTLQFKKATKQQSKLRLALSGPAGTGKTYSALSVGQHLGRIAFIDTERGSAAKYAHRFDFDVLELDNDYHPYRFIEAIHAAESAGYDVIIIDSLSHEWNGKNGILELHEAAVTRQKTKNSYTAWAEITPLHNELVNTILQSKCHIIAAMRAKSEYVQEKNEKTGRTEIRKVGMASIQRDGMDFEFDIMGELDVEHNLVITKTRCDELDGKVFKKPGKEFAEIVKGWIFDGAPTSLLGTPDLLKSLETIWIDSGNDQSKWEDYKKANLSNKNEKALEPIYKQWKSSYETKTAAAQEILNQHMEFGNETVQEGIATILDGQAINDLTLAQINKIIGLISKKTTNEIEEFKTQKEAA